MFKHILVPIDGSDCSLNALDFAAAFAAEQRARLTVCTVVDPAKAAAMSLGETSMAAACLDAIDEEAKEMLERATARVRSTSAVDRVFLEGPTVDAILDCASSCGADLIVVGSHGRTGLPRLFIGSVAESVIRHSSVPVLVVRQVPVTQRQRTGLKSEQAATQPA